MHLKEHLILRMQNAVISIEDEWNFAQAQNLSLLQSQKKWITILAFKHYHHDFGSVGN